VSERFIVKGLEPFIGRHCETTALKRVLDYHGLSLSEEMLLGLGGGIGFIYWYMKMMPAPFVGGRSGKGTDFVTNICRRIGAEVTIMETASSRKGYEELKAILGPGEPVVVYGDMAYLPYFAIPEVAHFGGHVFVVFGLDEAGDRVHIYDRSNKPVTVTRADLARARGSRFPPFPPKHRLLKIKYPPRLKNLEAGIKESIQECCRGMLEAPITNLGLSGMRKWAKLVTKWPEQFSGMNLLGALMNGFIYIETGGTGGSAFRPMYARFLEEASEITREPALNKVAALMRQSALVWSQIASGLMPDSRPALKRMRELMIEKNQLFEEQGQDALVAMNKINEDTDSLMGQAVKDLAAAPPDFLSGVQQSILKCHSLEQGAFQTLRSVISKEGLK
jgi:hypothetical protein